jgi:hypothetical protein
MPQGNFGILEEYLDENPSSATNITPELIGHF